MQVQELSVVNPIITANWLHLNKTRTKINYHEQYLIRLKPVEFIKGNSTQERSLSGST